VVNVHAKTKAAKRFGHASASLLVLIRIVVRRAAHANADKAGKLYQRGPVPWHPRL